MNTLNRNASNIPAIGAITKDATIIMPMAPTHQISTFRHRYPKVA
jgi:hypothetical protein